MLKKVSGVLLATTLLVSSAAGAAFAEQKPAAQATAKQTITIKVDGRAVNFKVAPTVQDGYVMVPADEFLKAIGGTAAWDTMTKSVLLAKDKTAIRLYMDSTVGYKAGKQVKAPAKSKAITGAILVPMTYVAQELGVPVTADTKTATFSITLPKKKK